MKIVVLSPHRNDAAFSLGLTIESWLEQGHAVEVMNVFTRTEHAPFSDAGSLHPNDRASFASAVRKREDEAWAKLYAGVAGRGRLTFDDLNLKDAPLRLHCSPAEVQSRVPLLTEKVMLKLTRSLETARADALVLPLGVGNHVDHLTVRMGALPADSGKQALAFYEDLPYAAQEPSALDAAVQAGSLAAGVPLQPCFAGGERPIEAAVTHKRRMTLCYDSQIDDATADAIAGFCGQYEGRERLWVNAAWRAAFPE
jgi:LmbE family N-acetylglucosaminyl deacetylase